MTAEPPAGSARLSALYQEMILDHYRRPRNKGTLEAPTATAAVKNPLCGDEIEIQITLDGDRIDALRFAGRGCSISQASASMMTEVVPGLCLADVRALIALMAAMLRGDPAAAADDRLGQLRALSGVARFPSRHRCASLPWEGLARLLASISDTKR